MCTIAVFVVLGGRGEGFGVLRVPVVRGIGDGGGWRAGFVGRVGGEVRGVGEGRAAVVGGGGGVGVHEVDAFLDGGVGVGFGGAGGGGVVVVAGGGFVGGGGEGDAGFGEAEVLLVVAGGGVLLASGDGVCLRVGWMVVVAHVLVVVGSFRTVCSPLHHYLAFVKGKWKYPI